MKQENEAREKQNSEILSKKFKREQILFYTATRDGDFLKITQLFSKYSSSSDNIFELLKGPKIDSKGEVLEKEFLPFENLLLKGFNGLFEIFSKCLLPEQINTIFHDHNLNFTFIIKTAVAASNTDLIRKLIKLIPDENRREELSAILTTALIDENKTVEKDMLEGRLVKAHKPVKGPIEGEMFTYEESLAFKGDSKKVRYVTKGGGTISITAKYAKIGDEVVIGSDSMDISSSSGKKGEFEVKHTTANAIASIGQLIKDKKTKGIPTIITILESLDDKKEVIKHLDYRVLQAYVIDNDYEHFKEAFGWLTSVEKLDAIKANKYCIPIWAASHGNVEMLQLVKSVSEEVFKNAAKPMIGCAAQKNHIDTLKYIIENLIVSTETREYLAIALTKKDANEETKKFIREQIDRIEVELSQQPGARFVVEKGVGSAVINR
jgi:hypothetical protein